MGPPGQRGVYFDSKGCRLLGTLFTGAGDGRRPTVIVLHGMPGIEKNHDLCHSLRSRGYNALVFHYRGCWGSEGTFSMEGTADDTTAAIDHLMGPELADIVDTERLFMVGHSMGGWAAVVAGTDARIRAVCASAPVVDLPAIPFSEEAAAHDYIPWLKGLTTPDFKRQWESLPTPYDAALSLGKPLLLIHGGGDDVIPISQSRALFEAASEPKDLIVHPHADHAFIGNRDWYVDTIVGWLQQL